MGRKFTSAEVEITSKDNTKPGIDSAKKRVGGITGFVKSYGAELAVIGASMYGVVKISQRLIEAYSEEEVALNSLRSAMQTSGTFTEENLKRLQSYATQIQRVTTIGDEAALALMSLGTSMGIGSDKIKEATEYAIGLSKVYGIDVNTAMRGVALAMQGQYTLLQRYIPALREAQSEEEKQAAFLKATTAGYMQAQEATKTYAGMMLQLKNQIGDIAEKLGALFIPILKTVLEWVQKGIDWFNNLSPTMQNIVLIIGMVVAGLVALLPAISAIIVIAPALGAAITIATGPIGIIIAAIAALAVGIVLLIKHWDEVKAFFVNLWETLKEFWSKIEPFVAAFVPLYGIPKLIVENWSQIVGFFQKIGDGIQAFVDRFLGLIDRIKSGTEKITGFFQTMSDKLVGHSIIPEMVTMIEESLKELTRYMEDDFQNSFVSTMDTVWSSAKTIGEGIKDTIKGVLSDMIRAIAKHYASIAAAFLLTLQFRRAAMYFAASAALYAASGAIRKMQKGGEFVTNGPELMLVGDNPSGKERVSVTPAESPAFQGGGGPMGGDVYFDGTKVGRWIARQIRAKEIPLYRGALVSS